MKQNIEFCTSVEIPPAGWNLHEWLYNWNKTCRTVSFNPFNPEKLQIGSQYNTNGYTIETKRSVTRAHSWQLLKMWRLVRGCIAQSLTIWNERQAHITSARNFYIKMKFIAAWRQLVISIHLFVYKTITSPTCNHVISLLSHWNTDILPSPVQIPVRLIRFGNRTGGARIL